MYKDYSKLGTSLQFCRGTCPQQLPSPSDYPMQNQITAAVKWQTMTILPYSTLASLKDVHIWISRDFFFNMDK